MSKTILVQFKGEDNVSSKAKNVEQSVQKLGKQSKKTTDTMDKGFNDINTRLNQLGNRFRFMTIAFGALSVASIAVGRSFITAAREMEQAQLKLGVFAASAGEDFNAVNAAAMRLYSTGLIPIQDASEGLANLLATGLGLDKAEKLMNTFLNSAVVAKESLNDTFGKAIVKATLGVRIFQERQIDAIGINTRLDKVFQDYAKTIGVVSTKLTNAQKYQAIYNFYMKEGERFTGAAQLAAETFSGALSRLESSFTIMKASLGATIIPLIGSLADALISTTRTIANFAEKFPGLTSALISGTIVMTTFVASIAAVGAVVPLVTEGFKVMGITAARTLLPVLGMMALKFIAVAAAVGLVGYAILKISGKWDKWTNSMKNLSSRIAEVITPMEDMNDTIDETNKKLAKQIKQLQESITLSTRDFKEGMREWVESHDKTVTELKSQITSLERDYKTATQNIRDDFSKMNSDLSLSHARKVEDIQRQLDEEVSKGIWADQTRIRDLQRSLKRENEDYDLASKKNQDRRDDDLDAEKTKYDDRLSELQAKLSIELELEQKHAKLIAEARTWPILDEIEKRTRAYQERLVQYANEATELQTNNATMISSNDSLIQSSKDVADSISGPIDKIEQLKQSYNSAKLQASQLGSTMGIVGSTLSIQFNTWIDALKTYYEWVGKTNYSLDVLAGKALGLNRSLGETIALGVYRGINSLGAGLSSGFSASTPQFKEGGIIPGATNQAVPIIAHGGETVLPAGVQPVTININNPSVRQDSDIQAIANAVQQILSTQQRYRHVT